MTSPRYAGTADEAAKQVADAGRPDLAAVARRLFGLALGNPRAYLAVGRTDGPTLDALRILHPAHPALDSERT